MFGKKEGRKKERKKSFSYSYSFNPSIKVGDEDEEEEREMKYYYDELVLRASGRNLNLDQSLTRKGSTKYKIQFLSYFSSCLSTYVHLGRKFGCSVCNMQLISG